MAHDQIEAYDRAWNAEDDETRRSLLERAMAPDAQLVDPGAGSFSGRDAIDERIAGFSRRFPGARVTITSGVDAHNGFARYAWKIIDGQGRPVVDGLDVVELGEDGRIKRVIMFFGPLPPGDV